MRRSAGVIIQLSSQLEYRRFDVNDRSIVVNPHVERIGNRLTDVIPSELAERVDRGVYTASTDHHPVVVPYDTEEGVQADATIVVPDLDTVLIYATKASR